VWGLGKTDAKKKKNTFQLVLRGRDREKEEMYKGGGESENIECARPSERCPKSCRPTSSLEELKKGLRVVKMEKLSAPEQK